MADLQLGPDWEKLWDPAHGAHYYFNNATHESCWLPPLGESSDGQLRGLGLSVCDYA